MIRNMIGALSNHIRISHGGLVVSYLFWSIGNSKRTKQWLTHIDDFLHVIPSRLLTPDDTLNTSEMNQKKFTAFHRVEWVMDIDIWSVVAVTLEKNVAIVVMFTYRVVALSFSSARNVGRAMKRIMCCPEWNSAYRSIPLSPKLRNSSTTSDIVFCAVLRKSSLKICIQPPLFPPLSNASNHPPFEFVSFKETRLHST